MLGIILAGGRSTRMGTDKAFVEVNGRAMIDWVADALASATSEVLVVGRDEISGYKAIPDAVPQLGPLTGVVTALQIGQDVVCVAVDQPLVMATTLRALAQAGRDQSTARPVVPHVDGFAQVTCAFYPAAFLGAATKALKEGRSLWRAITDFGYETFTPPDSEDGRSWFSIDNPEAIAEASERFQPPM